MGMGEKKGSNPCRDEFIEELAFAAALVGAGVLFVKACTALCIAVLVVLNVLLLLRCTDRGGSWIKAFRVPRRKGSKVSRGQQKAEMNRRKERREQCLWLFAKVCVLIIPTVAFVYCVAGLRTMAGVLLCMAFVLLVLRVAMAKSVSNISGVIGIVGFCVSFSALWPWIYEQYTSAREAEEFYKTSVMMDQQEYDPDTALYYAEQARSKLPVLNVFFPEIPKSEDISHEMAYLEGMVSVKELLNLDRPLKQSEKTRAMRALGEANILEEMERGSKTYYRPCTLKAQIYTALGQYDEAKKWIAKSTAGENRGFSHIRAATLNACISKKIRGEKGERARIDASNHLHQAEIALTKKYGKRCDFKAKLDTVADVVTNMNSVATLRKTANELWAGCDSDEWVKARSEARWLYFWKGLWHLECDNRNWAGEKSAAVLANLNMALICDMNFYLAKYNMGICAHKYEKRDLAKEWFMDTIASSPEFSKALMTIGWLYALDDKYAVAEGYLRKAVKTDEDSVNCRMMLGKVLWEMEKYDEAIAQYAHAISLNPDNPELYAEKARSEAELSGGPRKAEHSLYIAKDVWERQSGIECGTNEFYAISGEVARRISRNIAGDKEIWAAYRRICMVCGDVAMKAEDFVSAERYYQAAMAQSADLKDAQLKLLEAQLCEAVRSGSENNTAEKVRQSLSEIRGDEKAMRDMTDAMRIRMGDLYYMTGDVRNAAFMYDSVRDGRWLKSKAKDKRAAIK